MARRGTSGRPDAADAAADDLYGRPLNEFIVARGERAKQARAGGDGEGAMAIGKLAKPNKVAWLANQLVRAHPDELRSLLELGDSMRHATASLDAERLRQDSRQQHQIIHALLQQAHILANAAGQAMSENPPAKTSPSRPPTRSTSPASWCPATAWPPTPAAW